MPYQGSLVVDAVAHAFNMRPDNCKNEYARELVDGNYERHVQIYSNEEYRIPKDRYFRNVSADELGGVLFDESHVDLAIYHAVHLDEFFEGGLTAVDKGIGMRERYPERVKVMGSVDPLADDKLDQVEYQIEELGVDGIKIYPAAYKDGEQLRVSLDDPDTARPIIEKAAELGVDHIGVHKSIPLIRETPTEFFEVDDVDRAAIEFPDVNFELVHAGWSFLEETVTLLAKHPNVYANLESTSGLLYAQPRRFAEILGEMLKWAGPDRILLASGNVIHPQFMLELFWNFQIPADLREGYGYPKVSDEVKRKIMGGNALDLYDVDRDALAATVESDEGRELAAPWSSYGV